MRQLPPVRVTLAAVQSSPVVLRALGSITADQEAAAYRTAAARLARGGLVPLTRDSWAALMAQRPDLAARVRRARGRR